MIEALLSEYARQLLENYQNIYAQLASQLRWLYFDDSFRLVTRVGYIDDGWVRARIDTSSALDVNLIEILRELSWTFYNIAESNKLLNSLSGALSSKSTDKFRVSVVDALPRSPFYLTDSAGNELSSYVKNLDTALSSIKNLLPSSLTSAGNFKAAIAEDSVGVAKDSTVSALKNALASVGTDKFRVSVVDALPLSPFNLTQVGGTALTARDWSGDFAKLQNLDTALSTRASESTLSGLSGKFPSAVALSDSLGNPTTTIIGAAALGWDGTYWRRLAVDSSNRLRTVVESVANPPNLDVALSTRASETTLSGIKSQTDKLSFDASNRLAIQNPPNLDVTLSSRASEATLSSFSSKFPSATALTDNMSNPSTTIVGSALLGWDGTYWRRVSIDTYGKLRIVVESILANPPNLDVALSTRASESTLSGLSGKFPSAVALADNLSNPTTTIVGSALLGWDGTYWRRLATDSSNRLRTVVESVANPSNLDVALSVIRDLFRPILKGSVFNSSVSANTNIFASDLAPTYAPTTFRIYACFNASGVLSIVRTKGGVTVTEQLNSGNALTANAAYVFDVLVESGETINLQYSVAATALVLKVVEVPGVVS